MSDALRPVGKALDERGLSIENTSKDILNELRALNRGVELSKKTSNVKKAVEKSKGKVDPSATMSFEFLQRRRARNDPGMDGYDASIYQELGLRPNDVRKGFEELIRRKEFSGEDLSDWEFDPSLLKEGKRGLFLKDALRELTAEGFLEPDPDWSPAPGVASAVTMAKVSGIRNPMSYAATMRNLKNAERIAQVRVKGIPPLENLLTRVRQAKEINQKKAIYRDFLMRYPEHVQAAVEVIAPLTEFGPDETR